MKSDNRHNKFIRDSRKWFAGLVNFSRGRKIFLSWSVKISLVGELLPSAYLYVAKLLSRQQLYVMIFCDKKFGSEMNANLLFYYNK